MSESIYRITIDRQVIKLLGEHLYGDTPSVINELIANAYDARAKNVWITIKTSSPYEIKIQDDGIGMTVDDINNYFLNIGYNRRTATELQQSISEYGHRDDMGQKGIGKLSVFALSKSVDLISTRNGVIAGCNLNFDIICGSQDGQPTSISDPVMDSEKLSENGSGTSIILHNVAKDLSKSYKFIRNSILRSFVLNDGILRVFIRKNEEAFEEIKRESFTAFSQMDTVLTITDEFDWVADKVSENEIETAYKSIQRYEDLVETTKSEKKNKRLDSIPIHLKVYDRERKNQVNFDFSFSGWIGTVKDANSFKTMLRQNGYSDEEIESKDIMTIDDNRISVYSRGKVGEYNILPKLKTKAQDDAYIIGEIYVNDFENDQLVDMATSNRRGYQEDDPRYEALCRNLKLAVSRVVTAKQKINRKKKEDKQEQETKEIEQKFIKGQNKSKRVFMTMPDEDKKDIEDDFMQFSRAVSLGYKTKQYTHLLISHKQDDVRTYGDFLIELLTTINPELKSIITFTSNPDYSIKKGKNIFEELKKCFRPDYYVVFLFTRSFYDSNACLAEAGAAWATNTQYMNFPIDVDFGDVDKPLDNARAGAKFLFDTDDHLKDFCLATQSILQSIDREYSLDCIIKKAKQILSSGRYSFSIPEYLPKRRFQIRPVCKNCGRPMTVKCLEKSVRYECECGRETPIDAIID